MNINGKWNPFGNIDDAVPVRYRPNLPCWARQLGWWARNPLHNLTAYWIGFKGKVKERPANIFYAGEGAILQFTKSHRLSYPLISYRGDKVEWYLGWRPSGMFGAALRKSNATGY